MNGNFMQRYNTLPTIKLKELVDNDFVSNVGTDFEPLKMDLMAIYLKRLATIETKTKRAKFEELELYQDYLDSLPPPFVFTYDDETESYIEF